MCSSEDDFKFIRTSGEMICEICEKPYWKHKHYLGALDNEDRPFLRELCDGTKVKL